MIEAIFLHISLFYYKNNCKNHTADYKCKTFFFGEETINFIDAEFKDTMTL